METFTYPYSHGSICTWRTYVRPDYYTLPRAVRNIYSGLKENKTLWEKFISKRSACDTLGIHDGEVDEGKSSCDESCNNVRYYASVSS